MSPRRAAPLLLAPLLVSAPLAAQDPPPGASAVVIAEQARLQQDPLTISERPGEAVAIQGEIAVVGSPLGEGNAAGSGIADVYLDIDGTWTHVFTLQANDGSSGGMFGASVAVDGNTILVGAPGAASAGAVYAFIRSAPEAQTWDQQARITPADIALNDQFGASVDLQGNTALIGSPLDDDSGPRSGSAYVFTRVSGDWSQEDKLLEAAGQSEDRFGQAVALSGDRALIGAPHIDFPNNFTGHATVFVRSGTSWSEEQTLTPSDGLAGDGFGSAVALDGFRALVGAPFDDDMGSQTGSAFAYRWLGTWSEVGKINDANGALGHQFGSAVAVDGSLGFVGAPLVPGEGPNTGRVVVERFTSEGTLVQEGVVEPSAPSSGAQYGASLSAEGGLLIVGAPLATITEGEGKDEVVNPQAGLSFVFSTEDTLFSNFVDLGNALAGTLGTATLSANGTLLPGDPLHLVLTGALPNTTSFVFVGFTRVDAPFKAGTLVPAPDVIRSIPIGPTGGFDVATSWPGDLLSGFEFFYQVWWPDAGGPDNAAASNGLQSIVP